MNTLNLSKDKVNAIISHGIDNLEGIEEGQESCDLHHELYNMDYFIIGTYEAKQWLGDEAFDAIAMVQKYENDNFGECQTDLGNVEKVANMVAYIIGEEVLGECDTLQCAWNEKLDTEQIKAIKEELEAMI